MFILLRMLLFLLSVAYIGYTFYFIQYCQADPKELAEITCSLNGWRMESKQMDNGKHLRFCLDRKNNIQWVQE